MELQISYSICAIVSKESILWKKKREIGAILRELWCRGYYVDTVGKNTKKIAEYIANQLKEDKMVEQMSMSELLDPFKQ